MQNNDQVKTTLSITGMSCASCQKLISLELSAQPGVAKVLVSFNARAAVIIHDPKKVTAAKLMAVIHALGYQVKKV